MSSAFAELLSEKSYDEILVQDILDRAGIGRTTFYAHYFDKEDVLESITAQILMLFTQQIAHSSTRQRVVPSLELFEHGVKLSRECQERLSQAERRIEILMRDNQGRATVRPFDPESELTAAGDEEGTQ